MHDEQRPRPQTGIVPTAKKTKRPPIPPQQKPGASPKHTMGTPAVPQICWCGHISPCHGPGPVRHGMIPKFGRFGRKMAQSSAKCPLGSDAQRRAPLIFGIGGLRCMRTACGLTLCLPNQGIIATTDQMAHSARCMHNG